MQKTDIVYSVWRTMLAQLLCLSLLEQHAAAAHCASCCVQLSDHTSSAIGDVAFLNVGMLACFVCAPCAACFLCIFALHSLHASALFVR